MVAAQGQRGIGTIAYRIESAPRKNGRQEAGGASRLAVSSAIAACARPFDATAAGESIGPVAHHPAGGSGRPRCFCSRSRITSAFVSVRPMWDLGVRNALAMGLRLVGPPPGQLAANKKGAPRYRKPRDAPSGLLNRRHDSARHEAELPPTEKIAAPRKKAPRDATA